MSEIDPVAEYRDHLQLLGRSAATVKRQSLLVRSFARYLSADSILNATPEDVESWLMSRRLLSDTRYSYISALAGFYRWACRRGHTDTDPTLLVDRPHLRRRLPRPIPDDDLEKALVDAPPRMRLWLCLAAYEGLRCMEIAGLSVDDLLLMARPPTIRVIGKGDKERIVPLAAETEAALAAFGIPRRGPLFPNPHTGSPLQPGTITRYVAAYLRSMGINCTCHQGRHWFGTEVYRQTRDLRATQELLGHSSPVTTSGYVKFSPEERTTLVVRNLSVRNGKGVTNT